MRDVCASFECDLRSFSCTDGSTVALEVGFPPKVALARLVNSLKGVSSRAAARGIPRPGGLLPRQQAPPVVRLLLRRHRDRRPAGRGPVHPPAEPGKRLTSSHPRWAPDVILALTGMTTRAVADIGTATSPRPRRGRPCQLTRDDRVLLTLLACVPA